MDFSELVYLACLGLLLALLGQLSVTTVAPTTIVGRLQLYTLGYDGRAKLRIRE